MSSLLDIQSIRKDFPVLNRQVNGKPLVYFDNAATSQTPKQVIQSIVDYYENYNANIHRGVLTLSQEATEAYEKARLHLTVRSYSRANNERRQQRSLVVVLYLPSQYH